MLIDRFFNANFSSFCGIMSAIIEERGELIGVPKTCL